MRKRYPGLLVLLAVVQFFPCKSTAASGDTLTVEKALSRYNLNTPLFSPDGAKAVVPVAQISTAPTATHLWMLDVASGTFTQFTSSPKSETNPKWSPDSKQLAFLSGRNGTTQIFLISMQGGEALQLTKCPVSVYNFEWSPDGKKIVFITGEEASDSIKKRQDDKFDEHAVSDDDKPSQVYTIDIASKATKQLFKQMWEVEEMAWIPGGSELLFVVNQLPSAALNVPKLVKFNLADSTVTYLASPGHSFWGGLLVSPDGKTVLFNGARTDGPTAQDLFIYQTAGNTFSNISGKTLDRGIHMSRFIDNHTFLCLVQKGFYSNLYTVKDDGSAMPYAFKDNIQSFDISHNGTLVYVKGGFSQLPELYIAKPGQEPVKVSGLNKSFAGIKLVEPQLITYKSFDGKSIEGALFKPAGSGNNKLLPLVLFIHGGPTGSFSDVYTPWVQLLVQNGYAVFCPNIRGSTGYGWDFIVANRKDWGGDDYKDVMAGVDYLIANEHIDSNRLGISGWSYGGYMAEWAITQTHRFKAAVSGAGMANLASEFGTESGPEYDNWFWGSPYENLDLFYKHSPIAYMKNAQTPTLIIQGEGDETDPIGQSQELYRGLRYYNVPAELVLYPREPHGFREMNHNIDFYNRMLKWFGKYL